MFDKWALLGGGIGFIISGLVSNHESFSAVGCLLVILFWSAVMNEVRKKDE